jgi:hypothetical protein
MCTRSALLRCGLAAADCQQFCQISNECYYSVGVNEIRCCQSRVLRVLYYSVQISYCTLSLPLRSDTVNGSSGEPEELEYCNVATHSAHDWHSTTPLPTPRGSLASHV